MKHAILVALGSLALAACGGGSGPTDGGTDLGADVAADAPPAGACTTPREVPCQDRMILDLALHDDMTSDGIVANVASGGDWVTTVDASAGGMNEAPNHPWTYVRFEDGGAVRVDIDDETALGSMDWDLAARRYVIRTNGGSSGPACVAAAAFPALDYAALDTVPADVSWDEDAFYTGSCVLIDDGSGLSGSPETAMGVWWSYDGCVKTTSTPFLVRVGGGRVIKLVVEAYYEIGQQQCNDNSTPGSNGGVYTWRWRFLD
jgi:heme-binding HmuY-like protein